MNKCCKCGCSKANLFYENLGEGLKYICINCLDEENQRKVDLGEIEEEQEDE